MNRTVKVITTLLFIIYILELVNVIILKDGAAISMAEHISQVPLSLRIEGINIIPFATIVEYLSGKSSLSISIENLLGNIFAFSPIGVFIPILFSKIRNFKKIIIISFCVSLFFEVIQVAFYLGSGDIDDIILNVMGTVLGFAVYKLFIKLMHKDIKMASV